MNKKTILFTMLTLAIGSQAFCMQQKLGTEEKRRLREGIQERIQTFSGRHVMPPEPPAPEILLDFINLLTPDEFKIILSVVSKSLYGDKEKVQKQTEEILTETPENLVRHIEQGNIINSPKHKLYITDELAQAVANLPIELILKFERFGHQRMAFLQQPIDD